jgi:suppressor for copper-sensitivity B
MGRVRALLGLALAGTAAWLLIVMTAEAGGRAAAITGSAVALAVVVLALARRRKGRVVASLVAALAALGLAGPLLVGRLAPLQAPIATGAVPWVPFTPERIPALVAQGTIVFVDVTADWCITCKVNKITLIERDTVATRLSAPGVVAMQADWTRPDARIAAYLARFGRYGIPFDAVHGPGAPDGIALSELPGEAELLAALERAK